MVTDSQIIEATTELSKRGYPPSIREIGEKVGLRSSSTVHARLSRLKDQGKIQWEPSQVRTLRVVSHV